MPNLANPTVFVNLTRRASPWVATATAALFVVGLTLSFLAPPDSQQGETAKIMYLHVPAAWMSTFVYGVMASHHAVDEGRHPGGRHVQGWVALLVVRRRQEGGASGRRRTALPSPWQPAASPGAVGWSKPVGLARLGISAPF